jgi:hypothetical protein
VVTLAADGTASLTGINQDTFTLPVNATLESIYLTVNTSVVFTFPPGITAYPFIQLYTAPPDSNTFTPAPATKTVVNTGYSGYTPSHTAIAASRQNIGLPLSAGTQILIGGHMETAGSAALLRDYHFSFTGGVLFHL